MKKLICDKCKKEVGEMAKGKIKKDAIVLCGDCKLLAGVPDFIKDMFGSKTGELN